MEADALARGRTVSPVGRVRGLLGSAAAVAVFLTAFALHVVAGAAGLDWLFAAAVVLIYLSAASLPALAWLLAGRQRRSRWWWALQVALALVFAGGALWASAGRELTWWVPLAAAALVAAGTGGVLAVAGRLTRRGGRRTPRRP